MQAMLNMQLVRKRKRGHKATRHEVRSGKESEGKARKNGCESVPSQISNTLYINKKVLFQLFRIVLCVLLESRSGALKANYLDLS